jgi:tetratricopeptide (TPR) repeat protein
MKTILILVAFALMCVSAHADETALSTYSISTTTQDVSDAAKGYQLHNQVNEIAVFIKDKRFSEAEKLANELRRTFESEFNTQQKQYTFQSNAEFIEFTITSNEKFERIDWGYMVCLQELAFIKSEKKDYLGSLELLKFIERVAPVSAISIAETGSVFNRLGKYDEALSAYQKALAISVKYASQRSHRAAALRGMGFALIELKRLDEADQVFEESLEIEPKNQLALTELVYIQGQREKSVSALKVIIENLSQAKEATYSGRCDIAQQLNDEVEVKIKGSQKVWKVNGNEIRKENLQELLVKNRIQFFVKCSDDLGKFKAYLKEEVQNGSKTAQILLSEIEAKKVQ